MSRTSNYLVCEGREIHYTEWSPAPEKEYCLDFYARLAVSLVDQLGIRELHWLGTSMGGAIGIRLAAGALKGRIRRLILNDIGPKLGAAHRRRQGHAALRPEDGDAIHPPSTGLRPVGCVGRHRCADIVPARLCLPEQGKRGQY